jgi:HAD superfamily phosphoserine phosphatase-like hydrolase
VYRQFVLFADIDGTLISRSLEQWLLLYLRRERKISRIRLLLNSLGHLIHWPLPRWFQWKLVYLQGHCEADVNQWIVNSWQQWIQQALIPESVQFLNGLRQTGVRIVLLSGTPKPLAVPIMDYLKVHEIIAAEPVIQDHCYTGGLAKPHPRGLKKVDYVQEWLTQNQIDWNHTIAMADHWQDRFLLSRVKFPIVTHPKPKLARLALANQWPVLNQVTRLPEFIAQVINQLNSGQSESDQ